MNTALISEWHNLSKYQISEDVATKRNDAFDEILSSGEKSYWVNILKIFLDINPDEKAITHFVTSFQKNDDSFPRIKMEKLIKALAAMALTAKIQEAILEITGEINIAEQSEEAEGVDDEDEISEEPDEEEQSSNCEIANVICTALMNATFLKQINVGTKIPLVKVATDFLSKYSSENRIVNLEDHENTIIEIEQRLSDETEEITAQDNLSVIQAAKAILKSNRIQEEELNILWWLFGEYSEIGGEYLVNIDKKSMSIIGARELHDLSHLASELPASKHLLRKILSLCKSDKSGTTAFSLKECIETLDVEMKKKIIGKYGNNVDELTPCMNVLLKYDLNGGIKNIKVNINEKLDLGILSSQFYKELTFLSAI